MTNTNNNGQTCFLALPSTLSVGVPSVFPRALLYLIIAIVVALILFFVISRCTNKRFSFTFPTILSFILLVALFFMVLNSMGNNLVSVSVPQVISSGPTHLGLDGVSKDNHYAGKKM
jgi:predicted PurR-regulated permease PerM